MTKKMKNQYQTVGNPNVITGEMATNCHLNKTPLFKKTELLNNRKEIHMNNVSIKKQNKFQRGDVFNVTSNGTLPIRDCKGWASRPAVIVSNDKFNKFSNIVQVVFLSTSKICLDGICPTHVSVKLAGTQSAAVCEHIMSVDKSRLTNYIGKVQDTELKSINEAILFAFGINHGINSDGIFLKWENYVRKYHIFPDNDFYQDESDNSQENEGHTKGLKGGDAFD